MKNTKIYAILHYDLLLYLKHYFNNHKKMIQKFYNYQLIKPLQKSNNMHFANILSN